MTQAVMSQEKLVEQIEQLLSEGVESARTREAAAWDELAHPYGDKIVLFGAGNLGRKLLRGLRSVGIEPLAFSDNDPGLMGKRVQDLQVLSPADAAARYGKSAVFVLSIWRGEGSDRMPDRIAQTRAHGIDRVVPFLPLFWKYPEAFLPHYAVNLPHHLCRQSAQILAVAKLWADDASRFEFLAQLRFRFVGDLGGLPGPVQHEIYFPTDLFRCKGTDSFVDCGAFDGDTIRRYLVRVPDFAGRIDTFEPDPNNLVKLRAYVASLPSALGERIHVHPLAVSSSRKQVRFDATGTEAAAVGTSGSVVVEAAPLDEVLEGVTPSYIKMDTEGSEPAGIVGAKGHLERSAPNLALCVYHSQEHLWSIPALVHKYNADYRLFLRPHLLEGWDTVCYAATPSRLQGGSS